MQLVVPGLADAPRRDRRGVATYAIAPDVELDVYPLVALPADFARWGPDVVAGEAPRERVRVVAVAEKQTVDGWPVTVIASQLLDERGAIVEHRMHGCTRFLEYGGIAVVRAASEAALMRGVIALEPLLERVRPDFTGDGVVALAHVWAGL